MSREYKNILKLRNRAFGHERWENIAKEELKDSTPLPKPVLYEDIDKEMHRWVDEQLSISFEGKRLPTMNLYSNQRFSEYMQSWKFVDDNQNLILNFKTISRESNPQSGTITDEFKNIPGERTFLMKRVKSVDKNGREYYTDYRMKQPFGIDLVYKVSIMTNKYELINNFNLLVNEKFKSINCYIEPNNHYMSMVLDSISDDSEYSIDNRQFYSQSFFITVRAYIITEDSLIVEELPKLKFMGIDSELPRKSVEIEDYEISASDCPWNPYHYIPVKVTINMNYCCEKVKFTMDCDLTTKFIKISDTLRGFKLFVNDEEIELGEIIAVNQEDKVEGGLFFGDDNFNVGDRYVVFEYELEEGDEVKICGLKRYMSGEDVQLVIFGLDKSMIYNVEEYDEYLNEIDVDC